MEGMKKPLMVAALEFGTTNSGYAFSMIYEFEKDPINIPLNEPWSTGSGKDVSRKTPTCLLLDKEKQYEAFGCDAEDRYDELVFNNEQDNYYFFDRFTMSLHNNENVTRDMVLKDKTGKQCSAGEVFTLSIKAVVDWIMMELERIGVGLREDEIIWVLTVPAAWTDSAKQLMRESAENAGLRSKRLLFVTETKAAFTYCHYIPTTSLQGSRPGIMIKEPGTKSMVVVFGDMTADITVLQQNYNGKLKELFSATGDDCGGTSVDDRFCKMLEEIFGRNVTTESNRKESWAWLYMLRQLSEKMKSIRTWNTNVILKFPYSLHKICHELHGKDLKSVFKSSSYVHEITLVSDFLRINADVMIKLVTPTIDSIITLMKNTVSNRATNGVSNIVMVGGLSDCPMIQDAVYKAFPDNQIIIPNYPSLSVLQGAVLFGHRQYNRSELCDEECIGK